MGIVALSSGRGHRQDRRDHQDYPTKHAHRNPFKPAPLNRTPLARARCT